MNVDFYRTGKPGRLKSKFFACTPPCIVTISAGSPTLVNVASVAAGKRDPIYEIRVGQDFTCATSSFLDGTVLSVNVATRVVTMSTPATSAVTSGAAVFGYSTNFTVPSGVYVIWASYCGAGQPGGGGYTAAGGGGGGGGGASSAFIDVPLHVYPGQIIDITCGAAGLGGAKGSSGNPVLITGNVATPRTNLTDSNVDFSGVSLVLAQVPDYVESGYASGVLNYTPTGRPMLVTAQRAQPGGAANGGTGGYGAPEYALTSTITGGTGAIAATDVGYGAGNAGYGTNSKQYRGQYGWTGGAGGGGACSAAGSIPGEGGSDLLHSDNLITSASPGAGGAGGSGPFGKGGEGGAAGAVGGDGRGYGAGGGGGGSNASGGDAAPGCCFLYWL